MQLIVDYIVALTNLYGLVHREKVVDIYNEQNKSKISLGDLDSVVEQHTDDLISRFAFPYKSYFVHETIYVFDEIDVQLSKRQGKPYYIPNKKELLKYKDPYYFERPKEYRVLLRYIEQNFFKGKIYLAKGLCDDIHIDCRLDFEIKDIFYQFDRRNILLKNEQQVGEIIDLVIDLANNVRLWENNGYTPHELARIVAKDNLKAKGLSDQLVNERNKVHLVTENKFENKTDWKRVGRNDSCPCGSGRKYKRCCLSKY